MDIDNDDLNHIISFYDGGIRYTDAMIGEFLAYSSKTSYLYDQSLIMVTSDHGEEFFEHGSILHWQLYFNLELLRSTDYAYTRIIEKEHKNKRACSEY